MINNINYYKNKLYKNKNNKTPVITTICVVVNVAFMFFIIKKT
jgi:hypothetical protein